VLIVVGGLHGGCKSDSQSLTNPQGIDANGTWNITYTLNNSTCAAADADPGTTNNVTIALAQDGTQLSSPGFPGSTGTIDTTTGQFTLIQDSVLFTVPLEGVTDGSTASGTWTHTQKLSAQGFGADCETVYDYTGTKISTNS
jgi:hypothetical protein